MWSGPRTRRAVLERQVAGRGALGRGEIDQCRHGTVGRIEVHGQPDAGAGQARQRALLDLCSRIVDDVATDDVGVVAQVEAGDRGRLLRRATELEVRWVA